MASVFVLVFVLFLPSLAEPVGVLPRYSGTSWAVEIDGGEGEAERLSRTHGLINRGQVRDAVNIYLNVTKVGSLSRHYHFELAEPANGDVSAAITKALSKEISVKHAEPQVVSQHEKRDYVVPVDPGWSKQWSLKSAGEVEGDGSQLPLDMRVEQVWLQGFTGRGVTTAVIDDGLEWKHGDLINNYDQSVSHDFTTDTSDPTPFRGDNHGTECAGVVAMSKNTLCGIGVAFDSKIGGIKINIEESMDVFEARALGYQHSRVDVYSSSWGPKDNGYTVEGPGRLVSMVLQSGAEKGRDGKGNVFVWAAGNGGDKLDSCAADGYVNSIYTIAVGSADQDGRQAYYDEDCSAKMAVTFSHNSRPAGPQVYTTTLDGRCTSGFTGTSASAPLLSGVIALALQANPDLTWRDVQYLIVYTSNIDILTVDDLATNGAGLKFSHHFGFGAIDAEALVTRARHWTNVPEQLNFTIPATQFECMISNGSTCELEFQFTTELGGNISSLEHVLISLSLSIIPTANDSLWNVTHDYEAEKDGEVGDWLQSPHPRRGDVEIELTSPAGTRSTLLPNRDYDFVNTEGYDNWPFMSVHFWGEDPTGTWTLRTTFRASSGRVFLTNVTLTGFGIAEEVSGNSNRGVCQNCLRGCGDVCDVCSELRLNYSLACVSTCPNATIEYNGYCIAGSVIYPTTPTGNSADDTTTVILVSVAAVVIVTLFVVALVVLVVVLVTRNRRKNRFSTYTATTVYWSLPDIDGNDDESVQI